MKALSNGKAWHRPRPDMQKKTLGIFCLLGYLLSVNAGLQASEMSQCAAKPPWTSLEFERKYLWITARSKLHAELLCGDPDTWLLTANSSVASNTEQLEFRLEPGTARVMSGERFSQGKNSRVKTYQYSSSGVERTRREPLQGEEDKPAANWSGVSSSSIALPTEVSAGAVLTSPLAILLLAGSPDLGSTGSEMELYVHSDHNFYRVTLRNMRSELVQSPLQPPAAEKQSAYILELEVEAAGTPIDKPDFELLGLQPPLSIYVSSASGLPIRISGSAPRMGSAELDLKAAEM